MKNPFEKFFGGGGAEVEDAPMKVEMPVERQIEEEKQVVDTIFEVRDDGVYVKDIYEGNIQGEEWTMIHNNPTDPEGAQRAHKAYRRQKGIVEGDYVM